MSGDIPQIKAKLQFYFLHVHDGLDRSKIRYADELAAMRKLFEVAAERTLLDCGRASLRTRGPNMTSVIPFPVPTSCSGHSMPGLTTPELRERAILNFYSAERRAHVDPLTAWERAQAFGRDLDRIAEVVRRS